MQITLVAIEIKLIKVYLTYYILSYEKIKNYLSKLK